MYLTIDHAENAAWALRKVLHLRHNEVRGVCIDHGICHLSWESNCMHHHAVCAPALSAYLQRRTNREHRRQGNMPPNSSTEYSISQRLEIALAHGVDSSTWQDL